MEGTSLATCRGSHFLDQGSIFSKVEDMGSHQLQVLKLGNLHRLRLTLPEEEKITRYAFFLYSVCSNLNGIFNIVKVIIA